MYENKHIAADSQQHFYQRLPFYLGTLNPSRQKTATGKNTAKINIQ